MRIAATPTLPACVNTNIVPVACFDSALGATHDYAGNILSGHVSNHVRFAARALCPDYDKLSAARQKMVRMEIDEMPVVEIVTCPHLLQRLEYICPFLDFADHALTVGNVLHELTAQARASVAGFVPAEKFRMVPCQVVHGIVIPLMPLVLGDALYDPRVFRLGLHDGDRTRKLATLIFVKSARKTETRRAKNGLTTYENRAFYKHLVAATLGKHKPYTETGMWREFSIEQIGGGLWAQKNQNNQATFLLPEGMVFRDWEDAGSNE
jgi:hypothetical protein